MFKASLGYMILLFKKKQEILPHLPKQVDVVLQDKTFI